MFWKKKKADEPTVKAPDDVKRYECLAPNYLDVLYDEEGVSYDDFKEAIFEKIEPKVYTDEDLNLLSTKLELDVRKAFIWSDIKYRQNPNQKTVISGEYRPNGYTELASQEHKDLLDDKIDWDKFHTMVDIQNIKKEVGFDVYKVVNWEYFTKATRTHLDDNTVVVFYRKSTGSQ